MQYRQVAGMPVIDGALYPVGYVQMTGITVAASLTSLPSGTIVVLLQAEAQAIRWRDDGVDPTASVGMLLQPNTLFVYNGNPAALKVIEAVSGAILNLTYYK